MKKFILTALLAGSFVSVGAAGALSEQFNKYRPLLSNLGPIVKDVKLENLNAIKQDAANLASQLEEIVNALRPYQGVLPTAAAAFKSGQITDLFPIAEKIPAALEAISSSVNIDDIAKTSGNLLINLKDIIQPLLTEENLNTLVEFANALGLGGLLEQYKGRLKAIGINLQQLADNVKPIVENLAPQLEGKLQSVIADLK